ncbi:MAG: FAD-dependent oxidoreductase, partial [Planctomycetota bacterium]|nr:FAD-dependent oxidoreductase [Planctomycetota bacterium]
MRKACPQPRRHPVRSRPTRREVLRGVAASALLPAAVLPSARRSSNDPLDVAIVGGGVSGCYAAWRLANAGASKESIRIFERGDRIGGRLYSVPCKGLTEQVAELGGMRIAENQTPLLGLVKTLGLETEPYP